MSGWDWSGNVRELENVVERAVILTNHNVIMPEDLPDYINKNAGKISILGKDISDQTLDEVEKCHILIALEKYTWNQKKASEALGISTTTLWRKLKTYGIAPKRKD